MKALSGLRSRLSRGSSAKKLAFGSSKSLPAEEISEELDAADEATEDELEEESLPQQQAPQQQQAPAVHRSPTAAAPAARRISHASSGSSDALEP